MIAYPYYIVVSRCGRLQTPIQYRHTPIEKMFKSGKIGGTKSVEFVFNSPTETQQKAFAEERDGKMVEVLCVPAINHPRHICQRWRERGWQGERV